MIINRRKNCRLTKKYRTQMTRRRALYEQAVKVNMQYMDKCLAALEDMRNASRATAIPAN